MKLNYLSLLMAVIFFSCAKSEDQLEQFTPQALNFSKQDSIIGKYYTDIGFSHNQNLSIIYDKYFNDTVKNPSQFYADSIALSSLNNIKINNNASNYLSDSVWLMRVEEDVIYPILNGQKVDTSEFPLVLTSNYNQLKDLVLNSSSTDPLYLNGIIDNYYFDHMHDFQDSAALISFTAFASTLKYSLQFWDSKTQNSTNRLIGPGDGKAIAVADGVGALKGAWEFGRIGAAIGGGAGAFIVGATGAIFSGAVASGEAGLITKIGSWTGWW